MRSNAKSKIIILSALGILFALSPVITVNLSFITGNNNKSSKYCDDINLDKENLKISAISGKIRIINNSGWVAFENAGNCTGDGIYSDPYVIEDLVIDANNTGSCILIENSDVYFIIENCTVYNSGSYPGAGIRLLNVNNSRLIDNNCSSNVDFGIYLSGCNNNTSSGNIVNNNGWIGIKIYDSNDNTISGNTVNNNYNLGIYLGESDNNIVSGNIANINGNFGISLSSSHNNTISENTANNNKYGLYLVESDNNIISGNTLLGNDECILEFNCEGNIFEENDCSKGDGTPFELIILISIIGGGAIVSVVTILLIRHKKKRIQ